MPKNNDISQEDLKKLLQKSADWCSNNPKHDLGVNEMNLFFAILAESFDCKGKPGTIAEGVYRLLDVFDITLKTKKIEDL